MEWILLGGTLFLAFVNGANDNLKGVATLYGSHMLSYRQALALATGSTALGSLVSVFLAGSLIRAFSAKGVVPDAALQTGFLAAVGLAAAITVSIATRLGLPISTTHALLGSLAGAGWVMAGSDLNLGVLGSGFALPLVASPLMAVALAWSLQRGASRLGLDPASKSVASAVSRGHLVSGSLLGFARGLNDTPKIVGLLAGASLLAPLPAAVAVGAFMALGGLLAARRVTETLALRITPMTEGQGLAGNLASSSLVIAASHFGLPVSTTHVSGGGILGVGAYGGQLRWRATLQVLSAWLVTLPVAAVLAAALAWSLRAQS